MSELHLKNLLFSGRGSSALWAILKSIEKPHTKILLPVNICEIIIPVIQSVEMIPVFYDVNENTGNATLKDIENAYSGEETVLLAVHNFGQPLEIDIIASWAQQKKIFLIEDVCNALGASYKNIPLGLWGDAAIFSFGYVKIIEHGVGGAALIKDENLKNRVQDLISSLPEYSEVYVKQNNFFQEQVRKIRNEEDNLYNSDYKKLYTDYSSYLFYKISEEEIIQIITKLKFLQENIKHRVINADIYRQGIVSKKIIHPSNIDGRIYWRYNLLVESSIRDEVLLDLRNNNILASTWYPPIAHLFYDSFLENSFQGAYKFSKKIINLFVDYRVSEADILRTINLLNKI